MYNEALKSEFIQETTDNISVARSYSKLFAATEPYEERWGADLCTRDANDSQIMVNEILGLRQSSIRVRMIWLKTYVKWCVDRGIPGACDGMLQIKDVGVDRVKERMVSSPFHLQVYLDSVFCPESEETTDNIYRCFYWLAYGGMKEEDILNVKVSDVDFDNTVHGTFLNVDDLAFELISCAEFHNKHLLPFFRFLLLYKRIFHRLYLCVCRYACFLSAKSGIRLCTAAGYWQGRFRFLWGTPRAVFLCSGATKPAGCPAFDPGTGTGVSPQKALPSLPHR